MRLPLALAVLVTFGASVPVPAATPRPAPVRVDHCADALFAEKDAADDRLPPQRQYGAAVAGLAANAKCDDAEDRFLNDAFLHAMKAMAEYGVPGTDWRADLRIADAALRACSAGTRFALPPVVRSSCRTQLELDGRITQQRDAYEKAGGSPTPWPSSSAQPA